MPGLSHRGKPGVILPPEPAPWYNGRTMLTRNDDIPGSARHVIEPCQAVFQNWSGRSLVAGYLYGSALGFRCRTDSDLDVAILRHDCHCLPPF